MPNDGAGMVVLASNLTTNISTVPVFLDRRNYANGGSERLKSRNPALIRIDRAGATGTIAVRGIDLPSTNPGLDDSVNGELHKSDGSTLIIDTGIDYEAPDTSLYNWIVTIGPGGEAQTVLTGAGAAAAGVSVAVTDNSGKARITFDAADLPAAEKRFGIYKVTNSEIIAAGTHQFGRYGVQARDLMHVVGAGTPSATTVTIENTPGAD